MRFQAIALCLSLLVPTQEAFVVVSPMTKTKTVSLASSPSSPQEPSIEALREAAAKARQEAERLRQVCV